MDKYKHRVSFRLEKRKDKSGNLPEELPINADREAERTHQDAESSSEV